MLVTPVLDTGVHGAAKRARAALGCRVKPGNDKVEERAKRIAQAGCDRSWRAMISFCTSVAPS